MVNFAPRGPKDNDPPVLLRFSVTPGKILILLQKRNDMALICSDIVIT